MGRALSWALGDTRREHLRITTPVVHPTSRWVTVPDGSAVTVAFDGTVAGEAMGTTRRTLRPARTDVSLGRQAAAGSTAVAVADAQDARPVHPARPPHAPVHAVRRRVRRRHRNRAHDAAQGGYLPLDWQPSGDDVPRTRAAQAGASVDAPGGTFTWRFTNTPAELKREWKVGEANEIVRGAVMRFQDTHHLEVDAFAELGTFPVFEHLTSTTMSGTNPDGSHYDDPGVTWVSYFNGGDALHAFNRASFGTPQSLGCVELPEASAKKV